MIGRDEDDALVLRVVDALCAEIGAAAERNHQFHDAVEYFETSLKLKPDFVEAMNYLGYMWAERGMKTALSGP